jgi:DNA-directed RNA polymerase subunit M/transcription elongation factor TFIIS
MRTTCPSCNNALTIREVIQNSCSKCAAKERDRHTVGGNSQNTSASIKTNFDALISQELKKRLSFQSAA